jgi:hypothetical protein
VVPHRRGPAVEHALDGAPVGRTGRAMGCPRAAASDQRAGPQHPPGRQAAHRPPPSPSGHASCHGDDRTSRAGGRTGAGREGRTRRRGLRVQLGDDAGKRVQGQGNARETGDGRGGRATDRAGRTAERAPTDPGPRPCGPPSEPTPAAAPRPTHRRANRPRPPTRPDGAADPSPARNGPNARPTDPARTARTDPAQIGTGRPSPYGRPTGPRPTGGRHTRLIEAIGIMPTGSYRTRAPGCGAWMTWPLPAYIATWLASAR